MRLGDLGAGMTLKVLNNALFAAHVQLAVDAIILAREQKLDPVLSVQVLAQSSGGSFALGLLSAAADPIARAAALREYLNKDVAVARAAAKVSGIDLGRIGQLTVGYE